MNVYSIEFDVLRDRAEARMAPGSGFQDVFASVICMQDAALSKNGKPLALAGIQDTLAFPVVANQMRRLFGPRGNAARQDLDTVSEEADFGAWVAYRKAEGKKREEGSDGRGKTGK